ncbi:MAG: T9SS type A sorting domain-containing protein, partial [Bacteroidales bacterium]|nr:T9SS type A sorting domain-containing protein [Bacteroidales bacterium]
FTLTNAEGCDSVVTLHLTINHSTTGIDTQVACNSFTWIDGQTYTESTDTPTFTLTNAEGCDSVVTLHLTVNHSTTGVDTQVACDSYIWIDGQTYTESTDTPTFTLTNAEGCDSIVTLHLTVNHSTTGIDTQVACDSFTWIDGQTYTESTDTPTFTLTNAEGCDSVVTLHLTINHSTTGIDTQVTCDSFTWIDGQTYTESTDTPTFTLTNAEGCDSVVTLHLTVNHSTTGVDTQVACDSFTWIDGQTYTESTNAPTFTLTNAEGCDSVVTLHLTINHTTTGIDTQVACDSFTWIDGQTYTESTNEPTFTLTNVEGCDSVVTLHLTINHSTTGIDTQVACDSFTWIDGQTYTESTSTPTFTLTNADGCDSVVTLNLTINHPVTSEITIETSDSCYTWNGETYCASGDYVQTLTAANGCDSVVTMHLTTSVGIEDYNLEVSMIVYPNPTSGILNVQCTRNNEEWTPDEIHLFDAYGKLIYMKTNISDMYLQTVQIDMSQYAYGFYFVKAVKNGKVVAVSKVVKS